MKAYESCELLLLSQFVRGGITIHKRHGRRDGGLPSQALNQL